MKELLAQWARWLSVSSLAMVLVPMPVPVDAAPKRTQSTQTKRALFSMY